MKKDLNTRLLLALGATLMLAGCATAPRSQPLYQWESYQDQVYGYFKGDSKEKQVAALEQDLEKMRAQGHIAPPGVHAHLGMLYSETGNDSKALEHLMAERTQYPESAVYIDALMTTYKK